MPLVCLFLLLLFGACRGTQCEDGCPASAALCCVLIDDSSTCCPYSTSCDPASGCVLSSLATPSEGKRYPLHEAITSVYISFTFAGKTIVFVICCAALAFAASFAYRTLLILVHQWHLSWIREGERLESSDEEPQPEGPADDANSELRPLTSEGQRTASESCCVVCGRSIDCVLMRCNHTILCYSCALTTRDCPKCHEKIHRRQKLFVV